MAKILLIETSSEVCSCAISIDGALAALSENVQTQQHTALLTLQIGECVKTAGIPLAALDAVAVSSGPGSYTALRVGASVAKGICYALQKPLIAVNTLHALAFASAASQARETLKENEIPVFIPMIDARRQEVWLAAYDKNMQKRTPAEPLVLENNSFEIWLKERLGPGSFVPVLSGNGMQKTESGGNSVNFIYSKIVRCSAAYLAEIAEGKFHKADFQDVAYFEPFYMKPPNITTPGPGPFAAK